MKLRPIRINGKTYELSEGDFGEILVEGQDIDKFLKQLEKDDPVTYAELVKKGADILQNEPKHARDIIDRNEELDPLREFLPDESDI